MTSRSNTLPNLRHAVLSAQTTALFETLDSRNRHAILFRLQTAKKADTRVRRIRRFVEMLAKNEKLYP